MNWYKWTLKKVQYFFMSLGVFFFFDNLWQWFEGDSLLTYAIVLTISSALIDLFLLLFKKFKYKIKELV